MKIVIVTDDKREHEAEIPKEFMCHSDIVIAREKGINPAEAAAELLFAGSVALRGSGIKPERNEILHTILKSG